MSEVASWQPSAPINILLKRAKIIQSIRNFFSERGIMEVETPAISHFATTEVHLHSFSTQYTPPGNSEHQTLYMTTSPEFFMKRLVAMGSGPIYQISRSYRNEEFGRHHNPEFTLLEWYRPRFDMYDLMNEVDDLLQQVCSFPAAEMISYQKIFTRYLEIDPLEADKKTLLDLIAQVDLTSAINGSEDKDTLLQLLFTMKIEPEIGKEKPTFVYHFPSGQAALAAISQEDGRVADRFEVYYKGLELANGFRELTDAEEQQRRFELDNKKRQQLSLNEMPIDQRFLAALQAGLPECSGVALGIDRLIMAALDLDDISDVMAFTIDNA